MSGGARPGAGRPRGSGSGRTRQIVSISLQPDERVSLENICAALNISQSDFVRLALRHSTVLAALHRELRPSDRTGD